jgi:DNA invertase Pin-like site-specific DNA recombinase
LSLYAYNNINYNPNDIIEDRVTYGGFINVELDKIFTVKQYQRNKKGNIISLSSEKNTEQQLMEIVKNEDIIFTSSLTNFSIDLISALSTVYKFSSMNVRVISIKEEFDSSGHREKTLLSFLPMMQNFRKTALKGTHTRRLQGIHKAVLEGKYKGRQAYTIDDFPNFRNLYTEYMCREIGKSDFAKQLGVSRPTLDRLLEDFTKPERR